MDFVPPVGNVTLCEEVVVPTLTFEAFESPILASFSLSKTDGRAGFAVGKEAMPIDFD
jgi:hypothetical protein